MTWDDLKTPIITSSLKKLNRHPSDFETELPEEYYRLVGRLMVNWAKLETSISAWLVFFSHDEELSRSQKPIQKLRYLRKFMQIARSQKIGDTLEFITSEYHKFLLTRNRIAHGYCEGYLLYNPEIFLYLMIEIPKKLTATWWTPQSRSK